MKPKYMAKGIGNGNQKNTEEVNRGGQDSAIRYSVVMMDDEEGDLSIYLYNML